MACKNYPECKTTKPIVNKIGAKCPKCNNGDKYLENLKKAKHSMDVQIIQSVTFYHGINQLEIFVINVDLIW